MIKKGISLIEVLVGTSLVLIVFLSLISAYNLFLKMSLKNTAKIQSAYLLEEGLEAIRSIRDESWDDNIAILNSGTDYGLSFNGSKWLTVSNPVYVASFYRYFEMNDVYRDANDDISLTGTLDNETKFFTFYVSWLENGATTTRSISAYFSKLF